MEWMTRSSFPVMKVAGTGSGPASSKVSGSDGLGTGGGGTGGTGGVADSVRRTVDDPDTRNALAGNTLPGLFRPFALSRPFAPSPMGCVRISSSVCSWRW